MAFNKRASFLTFSVSKMRCSLIWSNCVTNFDEEGFIMKLIFKITTFAFVLGSAHSLVQANQPSDSLELVCSDSNMLTPVEVIEDVCKRGDIIFTSSPAVYCDFNYEIVQLEGNNRNICKYIGKPRTFTKNVSAASESFEQ
jgi:hypothetical protein